MRRVCVCADSILVDGRKILRHFGKLTAVPWGERERGESMTRRVEREEGGERMGARERESWRQAKHFPCQSDIQKGYRRISL